jgi:putative ABC transport system substrate-binding protein
VPPTLAAKRATATNPIPIVMTNVGDALANGIVDNLGRPGGNITGDTFFAPELAAKRIELLKDALPSLRRIAVLANPGNPGAGRVLDAVAAAAASLRLAWHRFDVTDPGDLDGVFAAMAAKGVDALTVIEDAKIIVNLRQIAELAARRRLPSIGFVEYADVGGLLGYGVDFLALYRRVAVFVDKILKGANPAELPVQQATKFELIINLKTAKALGLTIPPSLLQRADQVIE